MLRSWRARGSLAARAVVALAVQSALLLALATILVCVGALVGTVAFLAVLAALVLAPISVVSDALWLAPIPVIAVAGVAVWLGTRGVRHRLEVARTRLLRYARPARMDTDESFVSAATRFAGLIGRPVPDLRVRDSDLPLCMTVYDGDGPVLIVSTELRRRLSTAEFEALLAHEFAHLANADHRVMSWAVAPVLVVEDVASADGWDSTLLQSFLLGLFAMLTLWGRLGVGVFSRGREYAADRAAAELTGDPGALASALETVSAQSSGAPDRDLRDHEHAVTARSAFPTLLHESDARCGLLAMHPRTETRIERLRRIAARS